MSFDELVAGYLEAARGLLLGGVDLLLIETVIDTLNAKAAIYAALTLFDETGISVPLAISGTITDASGRVLSGQTTEAFWNSIRHAQPLFVGLNCALGGRQLRPYVEELAAVADTYVCAYPNAGSAQRLRRIRRDSGGDGRDSARVRRVGPGQHRRWLLRHHARAHPPDRRRAQGPRAAQDSDDDSEVPPGRA